MTILEVDNLEKRFGKLVAVKDISIIVTKNANYEIKAIDVEKVIDKNGAGDAFAAGFLFGLSNDYEIDKCGALGNIAATEIITHYGARPKTKLSNLIKEINN